MSMSYDELKDKVLQRYGHIDSIPVPVYNALKSYKDNGVFALDDDKTNDILVGERDYKPEPLPAPSTYSYSSTDQYEDLKRNVGEVGYSGLDPVQQKLFQDQFAASKFARAGGSFEDAVKYVDSQAKGNLRTKFSDLGQGLRTLISFPVGGALGLLNTAHSYIEDLHPENPDYGKNVFDFSHDRQLEGARGEGLAGFVSDPLNAAMFVPGIGEARLLQKAGKLGTALRLGASVAEGVGYGVGDALLRGQPIDASTVVLGGLGGAFGSGFREYGKASFPLPSKHSTKIDPSQTEIIKENISDVLGYGLLPSSKKGFERQAEERANLIGEAYDKGVAAVDPSKVGDKAAHSLDPSMDALYQDVSRAHGINPVYEDRPYLTAADELFQKVGDSYRSRLSKRDALDATSERLLERDIERAKRSKVYRDLENQEIYGPDVYGGSDVASLRTTMSNPEMYKDPVAQTAMAKKDLGLAWRDAINQSLEADPRYSKFVTPDIKKGYKLASALDQVTQLPTKSNRMLNLPISVDPFLKSSLFFKSGEAIRRSNLGTRLGRIDEEKK